MYKNKLIVKSIVWQCDCGEEHTEDIHENNINAHFGCKKCGAYVMFDFDIVDKTKESFGDSKGRPKGFGDN